MENKIDNVRVTLTFWCVRITRVAVIRSVCVVEIHVTVNYTETLSVSLQSLYGKCMSPITQN
jgi:hypothetical protein